MNNERFQSLFEAANTTGEGLFDHYDFDSIWRYAVYESEFVQDDVAEIVSVWSQSPEGYGSLDVCMLVKLNDGRYGGIEAWCDTTGWDCQSGGTVIADSDLESLARRMGDEWRHRMDMPSDLQQP